MAGWWLGSVQGGGTAWRERRREWRLARPYLLQGSLHIRANRTRPAPPRGLKARRAREEKREKRRSEVQPLTRADPLTESCGWRGAAARAARVRRRRRQRPDGQAGSGPSRHTTPDRRPGRAPQRPLFASHLVRRRHGKRQRVRRCGAATRASHAPLRAPARETHRIYRRVRLDHDAGSVPLSWLEDK